MPMLNIGVPMAGAGVAYYSLPAIRSQAADSDAWCSNDSIGHREPEAEREALLYIHFSRRTFGIRISPRRCVGLVHWSRCTN